MKKVILLTLLVLAVASAAFACGHHGAPQNCYINGGHYHHGVYYGGHH
jgi:hypothetical protein